MKNTFFLTLLLLLVHCGGGQGSDLTEARLSDAESCENAVILEDFTRCIKKGMPRRNFIMNYPKDSDIQELSTVLTEIFDARCEKRSDLFSGAYKRTLFYDAETQKNYCVLYEYRDSNADGKVDLGWGTFIVDLNYEKALDFQAPHPYFEKDTYLQAVGLFKSTDARSFLMAGAHRNSDSRASDCQANYLRADVAHNANTLFQEVTAFLNFQEGLGAVPHHTLQLHGMARDSCPGVTVYLSHGKNRAAEAGDPIHVLKDNLKNYHPSWNIATPQEDDQNEELFCEFHATKNIQGRHLNGVAEDELCDQSAAGYSGNFIHIEQNSEARKAEFWTDAILDSF